MGVTILVSGLCLVQSIGMAGVPTSARLMCPDDEGHVMRLTVPARQIAEPARVDGEWFVAPDGQEYVAFEIHDLNVKFLDDQKRPISDRFTVDPSLSSLMTTSDGAAALEPPANWKFEHSISEGTVGAEGKVGCFRVPAGNAVRNKNVLENIVWTHPAKSVVFAIDRSTNITMKMDDEGKLRVSLTNDVRRVDQVGPGGGTFDHWEHLHIWRPHFTSPGVCPDREKTVVLTRRPICNLLLVDN